jgi:hypothetical protein
VAAKNKPNNDPKNPLIKSGDKVTTSYQPGAEDVIRTVTCVYWASQLNIWRIFTDAGPICECCQRPLNGNSSNINGLPDEQPITLKRWFRKVKKQG